MPVTIKTPYEIGKMRIASPLAADVLEIEGTLTDPNTIYSLHYGANLISFPYESPVSIADALPDEVESSFLGIIGEGVAASQISPGNWVGSLSSISATSGYWVKVDDSGVIELTEATPRGKEDFRRLQTWERAAAVKYRRSAPCPFPRAMPL